MRIVILGLSITSSWGNGHATTFRGLVRELRAEGHDILFLERDVPWYATNRDLPRPDYCRLGLYADREQLARDWEGEIRDADAVIVGSYVPEGIEVGRYVLRVARGVTAFYDIDTPVTLSTLERGDCEYLSPDLIRRYGLYLSFTGGPTLETLTRRWGAQRARPLYCSFDPALYFPDPGAGPIYDLGYMGTYSDDRQPALDALCLEPARLRPNIRFAVAGPLYPPEIAWPANVTRIDHIAPAEHRAFYCGQRFTLNITRQDMVRAGYSPSVRLFEAAACGTPIISDWWEGLDAFFCPDSEILIARSGADTLRILAETTEPERRAMGERARRKALGCHTAACRARELVGYLTESDGSPVG